MIRSALVLILFLFSHVYASEKDKCLLVMSYHQGYEWNDGIESGVEEKLSGKCKLEKIFMDTKRHPSVVHGKSVAKKAFEKIQQINPDIIIAADDNASLYLVNPYLKNKSIPVVFCGVNWTAEEYGYPYSNATGMVEVAPIVPLLKNIRRTIGDVRRGVYLSADVITEHKDFERYKADYAERGVKLVSRFVSTSDHWKLEFLNYQEYDFIVIGNNSGINDWNIKEIRDFVLRNSRALIVTNYQWMMPYAMIGMTKSAKEQGEWAGDVAAAVLDGLAINTIPVTINKSWNLYINTELLDVADIKLSNRILNRAHKTW